MPIVKVEAPEQARAYDIHIGHGLLKKAAGLLERCRGHRAMIVTDENVAPLYLDAMKAQLEAAGAQASAFVLPAGETIKCMAQLERIYDALIDAHITRQDFVVALGGGVVGDIAGYAACTYLRGVRFIQAPTTLLAQVDSSVGGKVAVNHPRGKNLLGAFYQPELVMIDCDTLKTLDARQVGAGLGEVIKYGCIADEELLTRLEQQEPDWPRIIRRCLACKAALVAQDERDEGPRRLLNFGHTFGHAMEALGGGRYTHGECVAAGMMEMLRWQTAHGSDQTAMRARLGTLLERYDLPRRLDLPETAWRQYLLRDKKRSGGEMTIAVLERPGHGVLWSVTPEELLEETRWM